MGIVRHLSFVSSESSMSSTFSDEICFSTTGPIEAKFHLNLPWGRERKVCIWDMGHLTKMVAMPI